MPRTIVYVDGFNLYYGALKDGPDKWLDLNAYFSKLLPQDRLVSIKYFTSVVDPPAAQRQRAYLDALETLPCVQIVFGKFQKRETKCRVRACQFIGHRVFRRQEEKQTDVNIALAMIDDVIEDRCDKLVLITGDSDLVGPVRWITQKHTTKRVVVYVPARKPIHPHEQLRLKKRTASVEMAKVAHVHKLLPVPLFRCCHFPATLTAPGKIITKPSSW